MWSLSICQCRSSSPLIRRSRVLSSKPYAHLTRSYASAPQPRPYNACKSTARSTTDALNKTSPLPLQGVLYTPSSTSRVNPPSSTHPPNLDLPTRSPTDPFYKYYYRLGRAYALFYKNGLKSLYTNYRLASALPHNLFFAPPSQVHQAVASGILSRADLQLLLRTKSDLWKLPPFVLMWVICGEFTPLVVVFVTGLVPRIIWLPKQFQKMREGARERRKVCRKEAGFEKTVGEVILRDDLSRLQGEERRRTLKYVAQALGLYASALDRYVPALIPSSMVRGRVERRLKDLEVDDFAIARDGGVRNMDQAEVIMACEVRGMDVLEKTECDLKKNLNEWVDERLRKAKVI